MRDRFGDALDRHITGNWGEDQFREEDDFRVDDELPCGICGRYPGEHNEDECREEYEA